MILPPVENDLPEMQNAEKDRKVQTGWGRWKENARAVRGLIERGERRGEERKEKSELDVMNSAFLTRVFLFGRS